MKRILGRTLALLLLCAPIQAAEPATGFVFHKDYLAHDTGVHHPERPERLRAIMTHLDRIGLMPKLNRIPARLVSERWILSVHERRYLAMLQDASTNAPLMLDSDTALSTHSVRAARRASGGVLAAIDAVMAGKVHNAFVAARPPGHHALADRAMGFCLLNHVAIAARYLQGAHGIGKVLIVDWDVHHGNATQAMFYNDDSVLYFSVHQAPYYPGTGAASERGSDAGRGFNINVPLAAGANDETLIDAFERSLVPAAARFEPEFILISAGFDGHRDDPLAHWQVTARGYAALTRIVKHIADRYAKGRLVSLLEGGYNLDGLSRSVAAHLEVLHEATPTSDH